MAVAICALLTAKRENERQLRRLVHRRTILEARQRTSQSSVAEHVAALEAANEKLKEKNVQIELHGREVYKLFRAASDQAQTLTEAKKEAEAASRAKSELLANMSHELRTPMTAMLGFSEVLVADLEEPDRKEMVATVLRNGEYLLRLIDDLLDLSRIEAGRLNVESVPCSPREIVAEVIELLEPRAREKGLVLLYECEGEIPSFIRTDSTRLRQILINLVGNAVKFTEMGSVRVVIKHSIQDAKDGCLGFRVIDTGIGMTSEQMSRLFVPFVQADTSSTRRYGGSGLGLAISKQLALLLGADITVDSVPGEGSVFTLTLAPSPAVQRTLGERDHDTLGQSSETAITLRETRLPLPCHILLAEDGPDNQRLISLLLEHAGADVTLVENGRQALDKGLRAQREGRPYDLILMDMQMPEMDGYVAATRLRESGYRGSIIALTAHTMKGDREKCEKAGCDDFLGKPISRDALLATVCRWGNEPSPENVRRSGCLGKDPVSPIEN